MLIQADAFDQAERALLTDHGFEPRKAYLMLEEGRPVRAGFEKPTIMKRGWEMADHQVYVFEGRKEWSVPAVLFGILNTRDLNTLERTMDWARSLYADNFDPANEAVQKRRHIRELIASGDPDVIVAGARTANDLDRVWTADNRQWMVTGFEAALDDLGIRRLSLCEMSQALDARGEPSGPWQDNRLEFSNEDPSEYITI